MRVQENDAFSRKFDNGVVLNHYEYWISRAKPEHITGRIAIPSGRVLNSVNVILSEIIRHSLLFEYKYNSYIPTAILLVFERNLHIVKL